MTDSVAFSEFIDVLIENINTNGLWSTIGDCVPLIAISVLFGLGVFFIVRLIVGIVRMRFGF